MSYFVTYTQIHTKSVFIKYLGNSAHTLRISTLNLKSYFPHIGGVGGNVGSKRVQWVSDCLHLLMMVSIRCPQQP